MKSILFFALLAIAAVGCDTPDNSTGTDISGMGDTTMATETQTGMMGDTTSGMPMDTVTTTTPMDTATMPNSSADTTMNQ